MLEAGLDEGDRGVVIDGLGIDGLDDAHFVHDAGDVRQQFAHPGAGFAVLPELVDGLHHRQRLLPRSHGGDALAQANGIGQLGFVKFFQARLVIKQFHLRGPARHEQVNHAPGFGREMRKAKKSLRFAGLIRQRLEKGGI